MPASSEFTSLETLPPAPGDAALAAVLLRDLAASVDGHHGGVRAAAVEVGDSGRFTVRRVRDTGSLVDADHAALAAPELFDGAAPSAATDVYAAACLALTRYLGSAPVKAPPLALRAPAAVRLAAVRQAHRTLPARLGALPAPFRGVFAQAVAKAPHLRPTPARLVALLEAAFAEAGPDVEQAARARVHRLVVLARVFEPGDGAGVLKAPASVGGFTPVSMPEHLPLRTLPSFSLRTRAARGVLIGAATVVALGGVGAAAVVGLGGGGTPRPEAITTTLAAPSTTSTPSVEPTVSSPPVSSSPAPRSSAGQPTAAPGNGSAAGGAGRDQGGQAGGYSYGGSNGNGCYHVQGLVALALGATPTGSNSATPTSSDSSSSSPSSSPSTTPTSPSPSLIPPSSPSSQPTQPSTQPSSPSSAPPAPPPASTGGGAGGVGNSGGGGNSGDGSGSSGC